MECVPPVVKEADVLIKSRQCFMSVLNLIDHCCRRIDPFDNGTVECNSSYFYYLNKYDQDASEGMSAKSAHDSMKPEGCG